MGTYGNPIQRAPNFEGGPSPSPNVTGLPMGPQPPTGGPGNYNWGNAGNPNAALASHWGPTTTMSPTGGPQAGNPFGLTGAGNYTGMSASLGNELGKIYGKGVGGELYQFLQSGAGYSGPLAQQSVDAQIQAMQHQANLGWGNISSQLGAMGVSPGSSVQGLAAGDYWSNVVAQENAITAQEYYTMWNESMNRETGMLESLLGDSAKYRANKGGGWMSWLKGGLDIAGSFLGLPGVGEALGGLFGHKPSPSSTVSDIGATSSGGDWSGSGGGIGAPNG